MTTTQLLLLCDYNYNDTDKYVSLSDVPQHIAVALICLSDRC